MEKILKIIQFISSILLIATVLLQSKNSSLSNLFGTGSSNFYATKRGAEKFLYISTIVLGVILSLSIIANIFVK